MKKLLSGGVLALVFAAASAGSNAQELQTRSGVVTAITAMQQQAPVQKTSAAGSTVGGAFGRTLGRLAGNAVARATGDYQVASEARTLVNGVGQDMSSGAPSAASGGAAYLVFVRFGDGTETALQTAVSNLSVGTRVRVVGIGSDALVMAE